MALSEPASGQKPVATEAVLAATARRASFAASAGTAVEYYDFTIYAYLATTVAPLFFPAENHVAALLSTLAIYASGFMARPIGGLIFSGRGDRIGRRKILLITVTMMGAATILTGLLPTYATIGVAAPLLLALLRVLQGIAAGGEIGGAAALVAESVPGRRRGLFGAATPIGAAVGTMIAALMVAAFSLLGPATMASWGWRLPFLTAAPLLVLCLVFRLRVEESPVFKELVARHKPTRTPLSELVSTHKAAVLRVVGITFGTGGASLVSQYLTVHLSELGYPIARSTWVIAAFPLVSLTVMSWAGRMSDRWGRRRVMIIGFLCLDVVAVPCFLAMEQHNLALALVAGLVLNIPYGVMQGPVFTLFAEQFPSRIRYSGISLGFNIGSVIGAGPSTVVAAWLIAITGLAASPAFHIVATSVVALLTLLTVAKTANTALPS